EKASNNFLGSWLSARTVKGLTTYRQCLAIFAKAGLRASARPKRVAPGPAIAQTGRGLSTASSFIPSLLEAGQCSVHARQTPIQRARSDKSPGSARIDQRTNREVGVMVSVSSP